MQIAQNLASVLLVVTMKVSTPLTKFGFQKINLNPTMCLAIQISKALIYQMEKQHTLMLKITGFYIKLALIR